MHSKNKIQNPKTMASEKPYDLEERTYLLQNIV